MNQFIQGKVKKLNPAPEKLNCAVVINQNTLLCSLFTKRQNIKLIKNYVS